MPQARDQNGVVVPGSFRMKPGFGQSVAYTGTAGTVTNEFSAVKASSTLTSNGTIPTDGDTVTVGANTYTFKTTLGGVGGQVLINGSAANALTNLDRAINHTGTPGTDYVNSGITAVVHPTVSSGSVTATTLVVTARTGGAAGNNIATSDTAGVRLEWTGGTLSGGLDDSRATRFVRVLVTTAAFIRIGVNPTAVAGDYAMAANVPETFAVVPGEKISAVQVASGGTLYVTELD